MHSIFSYLVPLSLYGRSISSQQSCKNFYFVSLHILKTTFNLHLQSTTLFNLRMTSKKILLHTMLPLLLGFCIYLFFHKPNLAIHHYLYRYCSIPNYYAAIKNNWLANFILNHAADVLWAYSFGIFLIISFQSIKNKYLKAAFILLIVSFTEIVQVFYPKIFTFDWLDLLFIVITQLIVFYKYESK